jgi:cytochrome P450
MLFASLVLLLVIFLSLYVYLKWRYCTTSSAIPGPPPEFLIGNMRQTGLLSGRKASHEVFLELKQIYGDVFTFWFGPCRCLVFSRVDHVQHIFTSRYIYETSDILTSIFALMIPKSLFPSRDQKWKRHARVVVPMLKRINILQYFDTILACTDRFIDTLLTKDDSGRKNLLSKCQELLLNITGSILLDHDLDGDSKKVQEKQQVPTQALKVVFSKQNLSIYFKKLNVRSCVSFSHYLFNYIVD